MPETPQTTDAAPLNGWKEIAAYLGRSVRSVQRYERELRLPVRRLHHPDGQTVYAFRHEIDRWRDEIARTGASISESSETPGVEAVASRPAGNLLRHKAIWLTLGLALAFVVGIFAIAQSTVRAVTTPVEVTIVGTRVQALDRNQRLIWSHELGVAATLAESSGAKHDVRDLDGDGDSEVIVPVRFGPQGRTASRSDSLLAFAQDGRLRWAITPENAFACSGERYAGPWQITALAIPVESGRGAGWVAFSHHTWWPSFVLEFKPDGTSSVRYVQTGWVFALAAWRTATGSYLAAAGVTNEHNQPIVALLDLAGDPSMTPFVHKRFACDGTPAGQPAAVLLLPNPETLAPRGRSYGYVRRLDVVGQELKVAIDADGGNVILHVGPDFSVRDLSFSDEYWMTHRALEQSGGIHPADKCPWVVQQTVRDWRPSSGWREILIRPTVRTTLAPAR